MRNFFFLIISFSFCLTVNAQVYINEIICNNQNTFADEDGEYSDWIELYNAGGSTVNLNNYTLSDDVDSLSKWTFPSINILPGNYLIVWCSGKNRIGSILHSNFELDSEGETIFLSDNTSSVIDNVSFTQLPADQSYGRRPDGNTYLYLLSESSFNATNDNANPLSGIVTSPPTFSLAGGMYDAPQILSFTHPDPQVVVHYTLDGSDPTPNSPVYSTPISIQSRIGDPDYYSLIRTCFNVHGWLPDWHPPLHPVYKATTIRARAFRLNYAAGPIQTNTYFIDPAIFSRYGNLPIVSLVSDPKNLFNDTTGIYVPGINYQPGTFHANYYKNWFRPANIEMYMPGGRLAFNSNFKISVNGQSSPSSPQKGINVNASDDYGITKIEFPLFENSQSIAKYIREFDKIKLRAWGSDRAMALFRDAYCASFMEKTDMDLEAYRPIVVFINGEYWGLQELRERNRDGSYYESHYLIDKKDPGFDILDGAYDLVLEGDADHWHDMINFINSNFLGNQASYDYVKTQMDVQSFMMNYMNSIYFIRGDWPDQNEAKWRPKIPGGKWKWIQWDMENTTGFYLNPWYDMFNTVINGSRGYGPSDMFNELIVNTEFKNQFINLFADYMNTEFLPQLADARVEKMKNELAPFFSEFQDRWQVNYNWQIQIDSIKWWMGVRPQYCKQQILNTFGLNAVRDVTINVSDSMHGNVRINSILLDGNTARTSVYTYPWTGQYFSGVPVTLTAIAKPGYRFVKWLPSNNTSPVITQNPFMNLSLTAEFDIDSTYHALLPPVINEVMSANASAITDNYGEYDDWLEIYNPNNDTIDIGGYYLTDNLVVPTRFYILTGSDSTRIPPHGYLLIWIDDDTDQGLLHTSFKLNSNGDFIALIAPDGLSIVDSVRFGILPDDVSFGRRFDASPQFIYFNPSTPGSTNWTISNEFVVINELEVRNISDIQDNFGEYSQWIELYNPYPDTVDLAGWKITNDPAHIVGHTFPLNNDSTKIVPHGFKLLWADQDIFQGILHLNFSLQQNGHLALFRPDNALSDSVSYPSLPDNISYGRVNDGDITWRYFSISTPDSNNVDLSIGIPEYEKNDLFVYPNPVTDDRIFFSMSISFSFYNALGQELLTATNANDLDISDFKEGIYFLRTTEGQTIRIIRE